MAQRLQDPRTAAVNERTGPRIRFFRIHNTDMKSKDLAGALGVTPSFMSMVERGQRGMKKAQLEKCAELLKCSYIVLTDPKDIPEEKLMVYNNFMMLLLNPIQSPSFPMIESFINSEASKIKPTE
jgi:transcriptional regulator with XRE-family HTH domain